MEFKPLSSKLNFPELEHKILKFWEKNKVLGKYLQKNKGKEKRFSFIDGPITANNPMGVHHARGRSLKDLYQRYKNMQGFEQRFQNGFDCQGLWVEVEVEKALGFNSKKDIEEFGKANFTNACVARVEEFSKVQTDQSRRLGYFMDWSNSYFTMSETNNLYIWQFLKKCQEMGLLYKDKTATAWCPRCETGLSKHEQADGYKDISDASIYLKFKIKDRKNEYFLVWTTTPWTLPANVMLALNPKHIYVKAEIDGEVLYLAKEAADRLLIKNYQKTDVKKLLGIEYEAPFAEFEAQKGIKHYTVQWQAVDPKEGTGVVHIAPGCGEEDFILGKELGAPVISPIDERGYFYKNYGFLSGKYSHSVGEGVMEDLKAKSLFFKKETITHSYPHCWRCKTKCVFRSEDNWFIKLGGIKENLKKAAKTARWIPDYVGKRMQDWLDNMSDWMISRKRFYGLSLPFYECKNCGGLTVVGSREELKKLAIKPELVDALSRLHRPWIDEIKIKCPECGKEVERVPDVGDCWLDAGVVPFSTLKYFEDRAYWEKWFPAELVSEMTEQVRLWFYSMLVYGVIFENKIPYLNVITYSEVRDEKGERMSKTKKNGIPYDEAVENMGADVMRWLYFATNPKNPLNFGYGPAEKAKKEFLLILWNCFKFFLDYVSFDLKGLEILKEERPEPENALDAWILSKLQKLIKNATEALDSYDSAKAALFISDFAVNDLSTWYIRESRRRIGLSVFNEKDKKACYSTLYYVLLLTSKLLAPFLPFFSEEMWQALKGESSVHLQGWPEFSQEAIDEELEKSMSFARNIASLSHFQRREKGIKVRQPLSLLKIKDKEGILKNHRDLLEILKEELNVKEIVFDDNINEEIELSTEISGELKSEWILRELARHIQAGRKEKEYKAGDLISVRYFAKDLLKETIEKGKDFVCAKTRAKMVEFDESLKEETTKGSQVFEIEGGKIIFQVNKINN